MEATSKQEDPVLPRIAAGDSGAIQEFMDRYKRLIWWLARQHAGDDAEDAVQEVYLEVWKNAHRYDPAVAAESTFVGMIARRRLIDRHRKARRRLDTEELSADDLLAPSDDSQDLEQSADAALARRAMRDLEPHERRVLMMSVYQGYSHSEISRATEIPLGTVKTYIRRGLGRVRRKLERAV